MSAEMYDTREAKQESHRAPQWLRTVPDFNMLDTVVPELLLDGDGWKMRSPCGDPAVAADFDANPRRRGAQELEVLAAERALRVCGGCTLRQICFTDAMEHGDVGILRAGFLPWQLKLLYTEYKARNSTT